MRSLKEIICLLVVEWPLFSAAQLKNMHFNKYSTKIPPHTYSYTYPKLVRSRMNEAQSHPNPLVWSVQNKIFAALIMIGICATILVMKESNKNYQFGRRDRQRQHGHGTEEGRYLVKK